VTWKARVIRSLSPGTGTDSVKDRPAGGGLGQAPGLQALSRFATAWTPTESRCTPLQLFYNLSTQQEVDLELLVRRLLILPARPPCVEVLVRP
jgi:hypothetical protein